MSNTREDPKTVDELGAIRSGQDRRAKDLQSAYDYVVCGSGSAGCVIASRLAANPSVASC